EVETMRISPRDAVLLSQDPLRLAGRQLGAFAAFLQRSSREHDLMWGRLDGIERLVSVIVAAAATPAADAARLEEIRLRFTREGMAAALDQEAARPHTQIGKTIAELKQKVG